MTATARRFSWRVRLAHVYDRATVRINANVAAATHGESVKELLGSGDATMPYQSFTLRQPPLTYVSAETPSGSASTLKVYVNDVLWQEVPFFYGRGANEHIYVTAARRRRPHHDSVRRRHHRRAAAHRTEQCARGISQGQRARRSGRSGAVRANLLSRPLGLKEVVNPEAAEGAEDPESRDDARKNAPTHRADARSRRIAARLRRLLRAPSPASPRPRRCGCGTAASAAFS